jgi:hypothetical protein
MPKASRKNITLLLEELTPLPHDRVPRYSDMLQLQKELSTAAPWQLTMTIATFP